MEEWRASRDSAGRTMEAHFKFLMAGCKVWRPDVNFLSTCQYVCLVSCQQLHNLARKMRPGAMCLRNLSA